MNFDTEPLMALQMLLGSTERREHMEHMSNVIPRKTQPVSPGDCVRCAVSPHLDFTCQPSSGAIWFGRHHVVDGSR